MGFRLTSRRASALKYPGIIPGILPVIPDGAEQARGIDIFSGRIRREICCPAGLRDHIVQGAAYGTFPLGRVDDGAAFSASDALHVLSLDSG
jgi:hypothetical protein